MNRQPRNKGFLKIILIVMIAIFVLGYFNIDLKKEVEKPINQQNAAYVQDVSETVWTKYLEKPVKYFWNNIFINLLWKTFVSNFERMRDGKPTDFELNAPYINMRPVAQ